MKAKRIFIMLIILLLVGFTSIYATDNYQTVDISTSNKEDLNKEIEYTDFVEVEKGMLIKDFIQLEKERRLNEWYADKQKEGWTVEFGNAEVYAINGTTWGDLYESRENGKLLETDIVRTNMEVEIGVSFYKMIDGNKVLGPTVGEGALVATVIKGDITGKGDIDVTDLSLMQEQIVETTQLKGAYKEAADMNSDKEIDVVDLSEIQEYIVNN